MYRSNTLPTTLVGCDCIFRKDSKGVLRLPMPQPEFPVIVESILLLRPGGLSPVRFVIIWPVGRRSSHMLADILCHLHSTPPQYITAPFKNSLPAVVKAKKEGERERIKEKGIP